MNSDWADFLASSHSPQSTLSPETLPALYGDLSHFGLLQFSSSDAEAFLHGQLTCDLRNLSTNNWTWGAYCSAKGRVLTNFILWREEKSFRMLLPRDLVETTRRRLQMFILRAEVTIEDLSDRVVILGLQSDRGATPFTVDRAERLSLLQQSAQRTLIIAPLEQAIAFWLSKRDGSRFASANEWDRLAIAQGEPWVLPETQDQFVPQMLNLEVLEAVSFSKGCYSGQEIVARSQHLGQVKRRMFRYRLEPGHTTTPGASIFANEQPVGVVVNVALAPDDFTDLLAVVQVSSHDAELRIGHADGAGLALQPLPYVIPMQH